MQALWDFNPGRRPIFTAALQSYLHRLQSPGRVGALITYLAPHTGVDDSATRRRDVGGRHACGQRRGGRRRRDGILQSAHLLVRCGHPYCVSAGYRAALEGNEAEVWGLEVVRGGHGGGRVRG